MSDKRMFEFVEGNSSKFWEVWRDGNEVRTRYGRIGSDGTVTVKSEGDDAAAEKLYNKLVKEKTGKGYVEKTGGSAPAKAAPAAAKAAPAPAAAKKPAKAAAKEDDDEDEDEGDDEGGGSSGGFVRYEVDEKFWAIKLDGSSHTVKFGKIGSNGAEKTKDFDSAAEAKKDHDKLVKEKTGKGYELVESDGDGDEDGDDEAPAPKAVAAVKKAAPAPAPKAAAPAASSGGDFARYEVDEKFWSIKLHGSSHTVCFGKQGTSGSSKTKDFDSAAEAKKDHDKLIKEKTNKGYELVSGGAAAAAAPAPAAAKKAAPVAEEDDEDEDGDDEGSGEGGGSWRRFEVDEKFWAIQLDGAAHTVKYGKIGSDGQEKTKTFDDEDEAKKDYEKLIKEKTGKGYEEIEE